MAYVLRFVQRFRAEHEAAFMTLEAQFAALEKRKGWPRGRRSRPFAGREPAHALVWECELESLAAVNQAITVMGSDADHARLLERQIRFFTEAWTEIYEVLDFFAPPGAPRRRTR